MLPDTQVKEFLARISRGDRVAFNELYEMSGTMLYSISFSLMKSEAEAKDCFQDALVKIWSRAKDYAPEKGNAVAWMVKVTRNTCLDRLRSRKRFDSAIERAAEEPPVRETQSNQVDANERTSRIASAMEKLPEEQRRAIELAFLQGMTQTEVASELKEPLGTIKARIRRGMLKLQASLKKEAPGSA